MGRLLPFIKGSLGLAAATVLQGLSVQPVTGGEFFELPINGKTVAFDEHLFYEVVDRKTAHAWSVIDKAAIAQQL